ncbi:MAG TPA: helix-turn-helix domain-containing protein [Candidatus Dormibacteraeota bacterium]|jgi:excisionase family DNA binding protein|nr:helix-turn-helix domain-containing protein [Candidatus Dormibacteraeota bacterium]
MATVGIREAARLLGVSTDTIRRRIERRDLPAHKDASGRWLIELDDSLVAQAVPPATEAMSSDREELIRLRAEKEALQTLLEEVRTSRDRTVEAEAELRRILAMLTLRSKRITGAEAVPETVEAPEPPRRWWQRRRPGLERRPEDDPQGPGSAG